MRNKIVDHLPAIVSVTLLVGLLGAYGLYPPFRDLINQMAEVLSSGDNERINNWIDQYGAWGPLIIMAGMLLQMLVFFLPSWGLMLVSVLAYGPVWGVLLAIAGIALAATVAYLIGRKLSETALERFLGKKQMKKVTDYTCQYGFWTVFIFRLAPFLSNDVISFVAGMLQMNYWRFILATMAGITPLAVLLAFFAGEPDRLKNGLIWVSVIGLLALAGKFAWDHYKKRNSDDEQTQGAG